MKTVVYEPRLEYKLIGWLPAPYVQYIDASIFGIENSTIFCYQATAFTNQILFKNPEKKLSSLRGKMTRQNEKEIDDQISDLRKGWDRNI
jgi:hypothetical protein